MNLITINTAFIHGERTERKVLELSEDLWQSDPMNPVVAQEVAKMNVERTVRSWDSWRIVRAAESLLLQFMGGNR